MQSRHFETCILGQGIAGTTLAWILGQRGRKFIVIDPVLHQSSSHIAAGLITPVTGPKLAKTAYWDECRNMAEKFYRSVEEKIGTTIFERQTALHLFRNETEQQRFALRLADPEYWSLKCCEVSPFDSPFLDAQLGGFEMPAAAQLNVPAYLDASRRHFESSGSFLKESIDLKQDLRITDHIVSIPRCGLSAERIIFCQGYTQPPNPWFDAIRFQPAKGEILTVSIPEVQVHRSIHAGVWLAPAPDGRAKLGSTFEWKQLNTQITAAAREEILERAAEWLRARIEVVDQQAAVRPTMLDFKPVLGCHPQDKRLGILNGLGTRGALMAPWLTTLLTNHLDQSAPIPAELDVKRWFRSPS